jgi:RNA polymerase sigma factor (sigma-70 family)
MPEPMPVIFVVDDEPSIRKSLSRLIRSAGLGVETFASAEEFLQRVPGDEPACVLLDIQMPALNGLELQEQLARAAYSLPVIFLTGHGDIPKSVEAMKKGAIDFLTKPFDDEDLLRAIHQALERDKRERQRYHVVRAIQQNLETLTEREHEILRYVLTGKLNKQIADALDISEKTVKVHRGRVMEKLRVSSVAELVHLAEKAGIHPAGKTKVQ